MTGPWFTLGAAAVLAFTGLLGCSDAPGASGSEDSTVAEPIIDGTAAIQPKYGAVGALVYYLPEFGVLDAFCSGTLVGPRAVVTARHCTPNIDLAIESGVVPAMAFGPDAFNPTVVVPITDYVAAPSGGVGTGLLLDGGRDVAVAHLASTPAGITPAKLGQWEDKLLGKQFQIAGFGIRNSASSYGQRFAGLGTARAISGRWYELLFKGDHKAYLDWYFTDSAAALPSEQEAQEWWKIYKLESKFELLAGGLPGEAVGCYGDSGGPLLLGTSDKDMTTYGVSFAVEGTISTVCGLGGGYLVFNRTMLAFVRGAI